MKQLSNLTKIVTKSKKRVGRGYGSGVGGHTTTKGNKGQKVRTKVKLTADGSKIKKSWLKRLPFLRGKSRNISYQTKPYIVGLKFLNDNLKKDQLVDIKLLSKLLKIEVSDLQKYGIKILSSSQKIDKSLTIDKQIYLSRRVKDKILTAGGKII